MKNLINTIANKLNAAVAAMFKMTITEWVIFVLALIALFFILAHPLTTLLLFVVLWFGSVGVRNAIRKVIAKWKS